ncbi:UNVERIFIED_CONTAM: hypothetical protein HDU68_003777 [Siphonaria sp. JEL0065]|nr:hypothetical protein HDU68_003777 [Siphonaria sp. JEL0065]
MSKLITTLNNSVESSAVKLKESIRVDEQELIPAIRDAKRVRDVTFTEATDAVKRCKTHLDKHEKTLTDLHKKLNKNTLDLNQIRLDLEREGRENNLHHKQEKIRLLTDMKAKMEEFQSLVSTLNAVRSLLLHTLLQT